MKSFTERVKSILSTLLSKEKVLTFLREKTVKLALKKILGSAMTGGFKAWIVKFIVTELFDTVVEPVIEYAIRKGHLFIDKQEGRIKLSKIERAKDENNADDYFDNIGSV